VPVLGENGSMLYLTAGFLAAALGYARLARLITPAVLFGSVLALSLYASVRVLSGAVAIALRTCRCRDCIWSSTTATASKGGSTGCWHGRLR